MKKRLFIGIPISEKVKKEINQQLLFVKGEFSDNHDARFTSLANWHITLIFLDWQDENEQNKIEAILNKVLIDTNGLPITIDGLGYGPEQSQPRMIWLTGDKKTDLVLEKI